MKYLYGLAILSCLLLWSSCRNDFETVANTGKLEFSRDTVFLDTIFSNIGSSTYNLKVYNRSDEDINIPTVRLGQGENSNYRLNVDGIPGKSFENIQINAKDSIFIFVETTVDVNGPTAGGDDFLYTDQILFDGGGNEQKVELVTLIKDAIFLFPADLGNGMFETLTLGQGEDATQIEGFFLDDDELTFTNEKPYVIYGFAAVPSNKTLTIQPGARIHFHAGSGILVAENASIKSMGTASADPDLMENEIIFEGDRLEPAFSDVPGQWAYIWLTSGSKDNEFNFTTIKNSTIGILVQNSPLTLRNVQVYNNSNFGVLAQTGFIYGENVVVNNSGISSFAGQLGGAYNFNHCTFANYWTNGFRSNPAISLDNFLEFADGIVVADLIEANFTNCIIYGNERREIGLSKLDEAQFNFNFTNSLIRFDDPFGDFSDNPLYDFTNTGLYTNIVLNEDPAFQDTNLNNFNIEKGISGAENIGVTQTNPPVNFDLNGVPRQNPSDAGAYESTDFPE